MPPGQDSNELHLSEDPAVEGLQVLGYTYVVPEVLEVERESLKESILTKRVARAWKRLNSWLPDPCIVQGPTSLVDCVLAHELAHLINEDHSRAFWATLGRIMADYEERKRRLRELGPGLVWQGPSAAPGRQKR